MIIPAAQITKRALILGVTLIAVVPRMPLDAKCSIGGNLSRNFRKLLLCIVAINLSRLFLSGNESYSPEFGFFSDFLGVIEVMGLSFLCYLTPYILETKLSHYIHLRPGAAFYGPLLATSVLSFMGLVFSRILHPRWYSLKKLAQVVSGPPVITSVKRFNQVSTAESHGKGFMMGQALVVMEYWHVLVQFCCFLGYALDRNHADKSSDDTAYDIMLESFRSIAFLGDWTRVLIHALFLNGIDEMDSMHVFSGEEAVLSHDPDTLRVDVETSDSHMQLGL
ncbi:MAG: hypothetical protein SGILL_009235, partial [Bacillariaceae sp.]